MGMMRRNLRACDTAPDEGATAPAIDTARGRAEMDAWTEPLLNPVAAKKGLMALASVAPTQPDPLASG